MGTKSGIAVRKIAPHTTPNAVCTLHLKRGVVMAATHEVSIDHGAIRGFACAAHAERAEGRRWLIDDAPRLLKKKEP